MELYEKLKIVDIDEDELIELYAMEGDTARVINFQFKNKINYIDLTGCRVRINAITSKYNVIYNDLTIVDAKRGIAQLKLTTALLTPGTTLYQLQITSPAGELKPKIMRLNVDSSLNVDGAIEGSNEFTALKNAINEVDGLIKTGNETNKSLSDNVKAGTTLKTGLDSSIANSKTSKRDLDSSINTGNALNKNLTSLNSTAQNTKNELDNSIATGDIQALINRVVELEKKGKKTLWEGEVNTKNSTITLSESLMNFDNLLIDYGFAGKATAIVDLKNQDGFKLIFGNLLNDDSGTTYSITEFEMSKTNETTLVITQNKELVNGNTVKQNPIYITKVEGIKF